MTLLPSSAFRPQPSRICLSAPPINSSGASQSVPTMPNLRARPFRGLDAARWHCEYVVPLTRYSGSKCRSETWRKRTPDGAGSECAPPTRHARTSATAALRRRIARSVDIFCAAAALRRRIARPAWAPRAPDLNFLLLRVSPQPGFYQITRSIYGFKSDLFILLDDYFDPGLSGFIQVPPRLSATHLKTSNATIVPRCVVFRRC